MSIKKVVKQIGIIGAGQAGLQLAIGLLQNGYRVCLVSKFTAQEILDGPIMSTQAMFATARRHEQALGLNFWDDEIPKNEHIFFTVAGVNQDSSLLHLTGRLSQPLQSVDQRLKFSRWLCEFERLGGHFYPQHATLDTLERVAEVCDLTIVAAGKSAINSLFPIDAEKTIHQEPARALAACYVTGMKPNPGGGGLHVNILPGIGEYFNMPGLTQHGPCDMMLFEGMIGGAFDDWQQVITPQQHLEKSLQLLKQHAPWEAARCENLRLTDCNAVLRGRYTPVIRHPVAALPSGRLVLGMADTVVLNDPIAGQGANNASKCANIYLNSILEQQNDFNAQWMQQTFDRYWSIAQWSTKLTELLLEPLSPQMMKLLMTAQHTPQLANLLVDCFDRTSELFPWIADSIKAQQLIDFFEKQVQQRGDHVTDDSPIFADIIKCFDPNSFSQRRLLKRFGIEVGAGLERAAMVCL